MASATTLYGKAASNYKSAKLLFDNATGDEDQLNASAYHLQQAMELSLKYLLEQNGVEYPKTHAIDQLIKLGNDNSLDLMLNEYLEEHAEMFSMWEAKPRYILGYSIEAKKIERALQEVDEYLARVAESETSEIQNEGPNQRSGA